MKGELMRTMTELEDHHNWQVVDRRRGTRTRWRCTHPAAKVIDYDHGEKAIEGRRKMRTKEDRGEIQVIEANAVVNRTVQYWIVL